MSKAEEIARALHNAMERAGRDQPDCEGPLITWDEVSEDTRAVAVAGVQSLLDDGTLGNQVVYVTIQGPMKSARETAEMIQREIARRPPGWTA